MIVCIVINNWLWR